MANDKKSYRALVLIATQKLADKAAEMFLEKNIPLQFRLNAEGTASSEIMDTLGFGSVDKHLLISTVTKELGAEMLGLLHSKLRLDAVNSGIAFTLPLTGASNIALRMIERTDTQNQALESGKDETTMNPMLENTHALIAVMVDRGFSADVMNCAREAGAGGGTVIHSRSIQSEDAVGFWGLSVQDEKEIVLILAKHDDKVKIMSAVSEKYGMKSEAKGLVISLPIESVMGL